jgi:hypothetical protein
MLPFLEAHLDIVVQIITFVIMGLIGYIRLKEGQRYQLEKITDILTRISEIKSSIALDAIKIDNRMSSYEARFELHLESQTPHKTCLAEISSNLSITSRLDRIQHDIVQLHNWTMTIVAGVRGQPPLSFKDSTEL